MNKEKQIEQMAKDLKDIDELPTDLIGIATILYEDEGWRKQEWISIDDKLPEYGGMYLVCNPQRMVSKVVTARYSKDSNRWCSADACCYHEGITHWMPLPEPPKMKGGKADA